ncbi:hypothetical protein Areg01_34660 [Actinoplanes regularis]|nr:hypothetical protein Areg01_34660 [Actinoplanes regularis]
MPVTRLRTSTSTMPGTLEQGYDKTRHAASSTTATSAATDTRRQKTSMSHTLTSPGLPETIADLIRL